jgi:hypothetical protein
MLRQELIPAMDDPSRNITAWVASATGGRLAGVATVECVNGDTGPEYELTCLGVSLDFRRQGVGRNLTMRAVAEVKAPDCLVYVNYKNNSMRSLVKNLGGEKTNNDQSWEWDVYELVPRRLERQLRANDRSLVRPFLIDQH